MMDPMLRHRTLLMARVELRGHRHPGQRYKHGWIPVGPADLSDLAAAVASGMKGKPVRLSGGQNGTVHLVTYNNGTKAVRKQLDDASDIVGTKAGDPVTQADAEVLAARLGQVIGAPVPRVLRTRPNAVVVDYVPGTSGDTLAPADQTKIVASDVGIRLGLFDLLAGGWDRDKNWISTPQGPVGIDHAFAWDGSDAPGLPALWALSPFSVHFARGLPGAHPLWTANPAPTTKWIDNPLTPGDVEWVRARLAEVKGDFDAAGRQDWWQFAADRLDAIAPFATGTESRFT